MNSSKLGMLMNCRDHLRHRSSSGLLRGNTPSQEGHPKLHFLGNHRRLRRTFGTSNQQTVCAVGRRLQYEMSCLRATACAHIALDRHKRGKIPALRLRNLRHQNPWTNRSPWWLHHLECVQTSVLETKPFGNYGSIGMQRASSEPEVERPNFNPDLGSVSAAGGEVSSLAVRELNRPRLIPTEATQRYLHTMFLARLYAQIRRKSRKLGSLYTVCATPRTFTLKPALSPTI